MIAVAKHIPSHHGNARVSRIFAESSELYIRNIQKVPKALEYLLNTHYFLQGLASAKTVQPETWDAPKLLMESNSW
jgi:hypothetical protein